ncbi:MAG: hypothetical protein PVH88_14125 [Ignavibacteria bacterium]|jgi:hypothetical protein
MSNELQQIVFLITALIIFGEALALFVGMEFFSETKVWLNTKNNVLLLLDILVGFTFLFVFIYIKECLDSNLLILLTVVSLAAHAFREVEYFTNTENKFCFNLPLLVINSVKIIGLIFYFL